MAQGQKFDKKQMAQILAEALMVGQAQAARINNISSRTIHNWKKQLKTDSELAEEFRKQKEAVDFRWMDQLPSVIEDVIEGIRRCAKTAEPDGKTIESLNNTLQLATKMQFALLNNPEIANRDRFSPFRD